MNHVKVNGQIVYFFENASPPILLDRALINFAGIYLTSSCSRSRGQRSKNARKCISSKTVECSDFILPGI